MPAPRPQLPPAPRPRGAAAAGPPDGHAGAWFAKARGRWRRVAAALPPDVLASITAAVPVPPRPISRAGLARRAADLAADWYPAATAAGACLPTRAGMPPAAAAAAAAACPAPDTATAAYLRRPAVDFGRRFVDVRRLEFSGDLPAAGYLAPGVLSGAFIDDLLTAGRPAVDVLALARPAAGAPHDGYDYAAGTWADAAAAETADMSSTERYDAAMAEGRFAGDMLPGLELPGALHGGRRTCGLGKTVGHIGDAASGHDGKACMRSCPMSCDGRPCRICFRFWADNEARKMADKMAAGIARARLADGGAAGGARTPVLHLVISLPPAEHAAWEAGGPAERARIRKAAIAELLARGRIWAACVVDHSYRFVEGLEGAYLSPHLHVLAIGWLDYRLNAERFLAYRNVPFETRSMRQANGRVINRVYGRGRGVFIKHISTLDTYDDVRDVSRYILSHSTASARRLGELAGGEHAVRWVGQLANGRTRAAEVSRYERGDLLANSGAALPGQITAARIWHVSAPDVDGNTLSRAAPRHVYEGTDHDAAMAALAAAAAGMQKDHPALTKNGGVLTMPDGPPVQVLEGTAPPDDWEAPPDDYLVLKLTGHSRDIAADMVRHAGAAAAERAAAIRADAVLASIAGASDIARAADHVQGAAAAAAEACFYLPHGSKHRADMLRRAGAAVRAAVACLAAAGRHVLISDDADGRRLAPLAAAVRAAAAAVARARSLIPEKSRWVVVRVHSRLDHLCPLCGARSGQLVWDPGGPGPPKLPAAAAMGMGIGADDGDAVDGKNQNAWICMPAAGWHGSCLLTRFRWLPAREWMKENRAPYLPAWDPSTRDLVYETGVLTAAPDVQRLAPAMQADVLWDVLYTKVRADLLAMREEDARESGVYYRVSREMIKERTRAMHVRPPGVA